MVLSLSLSLVYLMTLASATQYTVDKIYQGSSFFDDWNFYNHNDNLTNGNVNFVSGSTASSSQLAYVDSSTQNAVIRVDNTSTIAFGQNRNSVRVATKDQFSVGSVWITDMLHVPFGCSVWPAWWSQAAVWPQGGEIDTFEGVNQVTMNQMALHTEPGCSQVSPNQTSTIVNSTDCSYNQNGNEGCVVTNPTTASYGQAFADAGGGVFITEFAPSGISIWFYTRSQVPQSISGNASTIDTSTLGTPVANWPNGGCNIDQFFAPQELIFDITLCGDEAGNDAIFGQTCNGTCYENYVVGDGSSYGDAYFEVQYVRVYNNGTNNIISSTASHKTPASRGFITAVILLCLGLIFVLGL